jgi:hypothetical protein
MSKPWNPRLVQHRRRYRPQAVRGLRSNRLRDRLSSLAALAVVGGLVLAFPTMPPAMRGLAGGTEAVLVEDVWAVTAIDGDTLE